MPTVWSFTPDLDRVIRDTGKRIAGELECRVCGHREPCDADRASICLQRGWPQHCGQTMSLRSTGEAQGGPKGSDPAPGSR